VQSIELFAGAGGLGLGSNLAGARPQLIVERDRWCCATLRRNAHSQWPELFEGDIRSVDFRTQEGKIDLVTGGPPCQPFSMGGKHKANNDHRDMWSEAVRAVRETRPRAFIFENVKGLTRSSFSAYFSYITLQLTYPEITLADTESWAEHLTRLERHHSSGVLASNTESFRRAFSMQPTMASRSAVNGFSSSDFVMTFVPIGVSQMRRIALKRCNKTNRSAAPIGTYTDYLAATGLWFARSGILPALHCCLGSQCEMRLLICPILSEIRA
jgi:C-5 cytosine-specific DNA methylase